jgi:hypothetical protein
MFILFIILHICIIHGIIQIYLGSKFCLSLSETVGLRVPALYIRELSIFNICSSSKNRRPVRCTSAANVFCRTVDVSRTQTVSFNGIL